ncbi:MAG: rRNA maturation RNase YbeY [bacterium]
MSAPRKQPAALGVAVSAEGVRAPVSAVRIADAARVVLRAEKVKQSLISITLLDSRAMATLNREHLGHRGPTDVISFGFLAAEGAGVVGDIYICPAVARENAKAHGASVREELLRLVVHGVLHVLGHDHPVDERREHSAMWKRQERLLARILRPTA